jgi:hypothetical protein
MQAGCHLFVPLRSVAGSMTLTLTPSHDYITKLCRQQAKIIQNHGNDSVRNIGQGELRHRKFKRLKFDGGQAYGRSGV